MVNSNGEITSIVVTTELRSDNISFFEGPAFWWRSLETFLLFQGGRGFSACASHPFMLLK